MVSFMRSILFATLVVCALTNLPFAFAEGNEAVGTIQEPTPEKLEEKNFATTNVDSLNENTPVTKNDAIENELRSKDIGHDSQMNADSMNADRMVDETAAAPAPALAPAPAPASAAAATVDAPTAAVKPKTKKQIKKERKAAKMNKQKNLKVATMDEFGAGDSSSDMIGSSSQLNDLSSGRKQRKVFRKPSKPMGVKPKGKPQPPKADKGRKKNNSQKKAINI